LHGVSSQIVLSSVFRSLAVNEKRFDKDTTRAKSYMKDF
jgi:hypothetical protein